MAVAVSPPEMSLSVSVVVLRGTKSPDGTYGILLLRATTKALSLVSTKQNTKEHYNGIAHIGR
jgi:hypothetical protein